MRLSNIHTHTCFCDGKDTPEEMVQAAAKLGFVSLGFSGHGIWPSFAEAMTEEGQTEYRARILRLKEQYKDKMDILLGVEHEGGQCYDDLQWDFLIESVHDLPFEGKFYSIDWELPRTEAVIRDFCGGDAYKLTKTYFEYCAMCYERSPAQVAGHVDMITKFNQSGRLFDETDPRYLGPALEAVETAVRRGMVVEINTGAMARGYRTAPYPGPVLLKRVKELGGQVMLSSDCHDRHQLTAGYDDAILYLRSLGFDHTLILTADGWQEEIL